MSNISPYVGRTIHCPKQASINLPFQIHAEAVGVASPTYKNVSAGSYSATFRVCSVTSNTVVILKSSATASQLEKTDPTNGIVSVYIDAADTASLETGSYRYELWISYTGGSHTTSYPAVEGKFIIRDSLVS